MASSYSDVAAAISIPPPPHNSQAYHLLPASAPPCHCRRSTISFHSNATAADKFKVVLMGRHHLGNPQQFLPPHMITYPVFSQNIYDPILELRQQIINQIEYYFSMENLCDDKFLREIMDDEGYVPVSIIARFNRVRWITQNVDLILLSLHGSAIIEIKGDKLRRRGDWMTWLLPPRHSNEHARQEEVKSPPIIQGYSEVGEPEMNTSLTTDIQMDYGSRNAENTSQQEDSIIETSISYGARDADEIENADVENYIIVLQMQSGESKNGSFGNLIAPGQELFGHQIEGLEEQTYSEFHQKCLAERNRLGAGCKEMDALFRFWSCLLQSYFNCAIYEEFRQLAEEDAAGNNDYGLKCLLRFYRYRLERKFRLDLYVDFERMTLELCKKGNFFGLEKYRAFHCHRREGSELLKKHPELEMLLFQYEQAKQGPLKDKESCNKVKQNEVPPQLLTNDFSLPFAAR